MSSFLFASGVDVLLLISILASNFIKDEGDSESVETTFSTAVVSSISTEKTIAECLI